MGSSMPLYTPIFYKTASGAEPVARFLEKELDSAQRAALLAALHSILCHQGIDVCDTEYGKPLGKGLYEFRLRHTYEEIVAANPVASEVPAPGTGHRGGGEILLRLYFYPFGDKLLLLLGGYDKGKGGSGKREQKAIEAARKNLRDFKRTKRWDAFRQGLGRWMTRG